MSFIVSLFTKKNNKKNYQEYYDLFKKLKNSLSNSILDLSLTKQLINMMNESLKRKDEDECQFFRNIRKQFKYLVMDNYDKLKIEKKLNNYYYLVTILHFLFVIMNNFHNKNFFEIILEENSNLTNKLNKNLKLSQMFSDQHEVSKVLSSSFNIEFINLFIELDCITLFYKLKERFMGIIINLMEFSRYTYDEYKVLIKHILLFEFDYQKIFEDESFCNVEDKPICK